MTAEAASTNVWPVPLIDYMLTRGLPLAMAGLLASLAASVHLRRTRHSSSSNGSSDGSRGSTSGSGCAHPSSQGGVPGPWQAPQADTIATTAAEAAGCADAAAVLSGARIDAAQHSGSTGLDTSALLRPLPLESLGLSLLSHLGARPLLQR